MYVQKFQDNLMYINILPGIDLDLLALNDVLVVINRTFMILKTQDLFMLEVIISLSFVNRTRPMRLSTQNVLNNVSCLKCLKTYIVLS